DVEMDVSKAHSRSVRCGELRCRGHRESRGQKESKRDLSFHRPQSTRNYEQKEAQCGFAAVRSPFARNFPVISKNRSTHSQTAAAVKSPSLRCRESGPSES